ncbi:MAG: c-type cytochrome [Woeseiaceae bacterium]
MFRLTLFTLIQALVLSCAYGETHKNGLIDEGRQLYQTTVRSDGTAVRALVQHDVPLPPGLGACSNCHRRSGYGVSEGGSRSLNVTAPALFNATSKPPIRPAYNDQTLVQAIVAGIASDGRELDATMPRYELNQGDAAAFAAYLRTLGASPPDGVGDEELTIATIVAENAPANEREAVTRVLQKYVELRNNESRHDSERAAASSRHFYGRNPQKAFRRWKLLVWTLSGPTSTWRKQLDAYYAEQAPFIVLSGTAGADWPLVHDFCETREIPCILPVSSGPADADDAFYSLYYSTGPTLESAVIADHLKKSALAPNARVLVVHRDNPHDVEALHELRRALEDDSLIEISTTAVTGKRALSARKWRRLLQENKPDVLIAWLPQTSISKLLDSELADELLPQTIYTSQAFTNWSDTTRLPERRINHVYPYSIAHAGLAQFPREYLWLKQRGLSDLDPVAASKALYACRVLGLGLARIQTSFSREYLLEMLEHALDGTQMTSLFPRTSLGPNQRLLSRGAYVLTPNQLVDGENAYPLWVQP